MAGHWCDRDYPTLPQAHFGVYRAMEVIQAAFIGCYNEPMPLVWKLQIESGIWKQLTLLQHKHTKHPWTCSGGWHQHAWMFARQSLLKLLKSEVDERYDYCDFHWYYYLKFQRRFDFDCKHFVCHDGMLFK
jgi:hypothetical protein